MRLQEFVQASLEDIVSGVQQAHAQVARLGGTLNPVLESVATQAPHVSRPGGLVPVQVVEFDVAVTASSAQGAEAKAGIEVLGMSLGLGAKASTQSEAVSVSRLRFSVPIVLPTSREQ